jgi:hypothetical protein
MPAFAPEISYRVEPDGSAITDVQPWQAAVGLDNSKAAADAELKGEGEEEGVGVAEEPLADPDALGDGEDVEPAPPCGANTGSRAAVPWDF